MDKQIYLDSAATTKPSGEVVEFLSETLPDLYANPDSMHTLGLKAEKQTERSRAVIACALKAKSEEIIFTSSGTEANNLALFGAANSQKRKGNKIILTDAEHLSVYSPALELEKRGFEISFLSSKNGEIDMDELKNRLDAQVILISAMLVNNETGSVFDIAAILKTVENSGFTPYIHCDAAQAFGKIPIDLDRLKVDMMSLSAHKIHGIKGCGALFLRKGKRIAPQIFGGEQENGLRSSTLNTPGIFAFGKAAEEAFKNFDKNNRYIDALYDHTAARIKEKCPEVIFNQRQNSKNISKYIMSLRLPGIKSEVMTNYLSMHNIYISSGSACSEKRRGQKSPGRVLLNYGLDKNSADCSVRVSFSKYNTQQEADEFAEVLAEAINRFKGV